MQQIFDFPVKTLRTFERFVSCDGNAAAFQFACRIADMADPENLLYLHGPSGSGKTHLLQSISHALSGRGHCAPCLSCRDLASAESLVTAVADASALLLDDMHLLVDDGVRAAVWQVFNDFYASGRKVALAGLLPPRELPHLDDHLVSRLLWGLVARIDVSDDDSRRMILRKIADDRQVRVPDDVVDYILITTSREAGALISTFEGLYRRSLAEKRKITLALARECREAMNP